MPTIGAELSVVGFDDIAIASKIAPPLTTLRQRMAEMGRLAFSQVQVFAQGQRPEAHTSLLPADLIVRGSTGPPSGHHVHSLPHRKKVGKQMTTPGKLDLDQIAGQAKVTPATVWQMLFGNRKEVRAEDIARIQGAMDHLGLSTEEPQAKGKAGFILVVMPNAQSFGTYGGPVMQAFSSLAQQQNYLMTNFIPASSPDTDLVSLFRAFNYALMITTRDTQQLAEACEAAGRPYILAETDFLDPGGHGVSISLDNAQAARAAMAHLLDLGHRRIGFISGVPGHPSSEARQANYLAALQEAGIQPTREWIFLGDWEQESGYAGGQALLSLDERPTAIFCANDTMALGTMRAAHEAGLEIGYDVSIMGFDDIEAASHVTPALTTIRQHLAQMGQVAFECIQQLEAGRQPKRRILLPAELIVRESTGPVPRR